MRNLLKLLFSPAGRIGRRDYAIGLIGLVVIFTVYGLIINALGGSMTGFFAVLAFPFVILQIIYSVYGKRLHDMGRTLWPVTGLLCAILGAMIVVMLAYDGADYLAAFSEYSSNGPLTEELRDKLNREFGPRQAQGVPVLQVVVTGLLVAFTLWLGVAKADEKTNQYGAPLSK